jgi:hypothetical protein
MSSTIVLNSGFASIRWKLPFLPTILIIELFLFDNQDLTIGGPDVFYRMRSDDWVV